MMLIQDLTTGSVLTHGTLTGVKKVSSELSKEIAVLMMLPMAALPLLEKLNSSNDLPYFLESDFKSLSYKLINLTSLH